MTQSEINQVLVESVIPVQLDLAQEFQRTRQIADQLIKLAVALAVLNAVGIIALAIFVSPIFAGKVVLIEVMFGISAVCLGIVVGHGKIMTLLAQAEEIANLARDQAFVDLNMMRDELVRLRRKLSREVDADGHGAVNELLKTISPVVMMFVQKEKNIFRWGMFAWKVAQNAMAVIKERSKET